MVDYSFSQRESIVRSDEAREANLMTRSNSFDARFGRVPESRARFGSGDSGPSRERRSRGGLPPSTLAMASEAEEKARRVRSLLSSYYGSSGDAPFAPGARAVPAEPIDAPDFDAERYVRETLERVGLDARFETMLVIVAIFFIAFVLYYFVNWKYLSEVWPLS